MSTIAITRDTLAMAILPLLEQAEESVLYVLWQRSCENLDIGDWTAACCSSASLEVIRQLHRPGKRSERGGAK